MIGESRPMRELKSKINRLARATGCVLVRGESGVGKELVARACTVPASVPTGRCWRSTARRFRPT